MNTVWPLDDIFDDSCDIALFIPGPPGPPIVDVGSLVVSAGPPATPGPTSVVATIAAPINRRQRSFLKSGAGNLNNPAIPNPSDNGPWEYYLYWADAINTLTLDDAANIKLSGEWVATKDSILYIQWDGNSKYVEGGRNEI